MRPFRRRIKSHDGGREYEGAAGIDVLVLHDVAAGAVEGYGDRSGCRAATLGVETEVNDFIGPVEQDRRRRAAEQAGVGTVDASGSVVVEGDADVAALPIEPRQAAAKLPIVGEAADRRGPHHADQRIVDA